MTYFSGHMYFNQFITNIVADNVPSDATDKSNGTLRMATLSLPFIDQRTTSTQRDKIFVLKSVSLYNQSSAVIKTATPQET